MPDLSADSASLHIPRTCTRNGVDDEDRIGQGSSSRWPTPCCPLIPLQGCNISRSLLTLPLRSPHGMFLGTCTRVVHFWMESKQNVQPFCQCISLPLFLQFRGSFRRKTPLAVYRSYFWLLATLK